MQTSSHLSPVLSGLLNRVPSKGTYKNGVLNPERSLVFFPSSLLSPKPGCHQERTLSPHLISVWDQTHPSWLCWGGPSICPGPGKKEGSFPDPELAACVPQLPVLLMEKYLFPSPLPELLFSLFLGGGGHFLPFIQSQLNNRSLGMQQFLTTLTPLPHSCSSYRRLSKVCTVTCLPPKTLCIGSEISPLEDGGAGCFPLKAFGSSSPKA